MRCGLVWHEGAFGMVGHGEWALSSVAAAGARSGVGWIVDTGSFAWSFVSLVCFLLQPADQRLRY